MFKTQTLIIQIQKCKLSLPQSEFLFFRVAFSCGQTAKFVGLAVSYVRCAIWPATKRKLYLRITIAKLQNIS